MTLQAVYFDLGGVIVRTEYQAPRQHLAERLGLDYEDLIKLVFDSETARQASIGQLSEDEHWAAVIRRLHLPESETPAIRGEFFAGDIIDLGLLDFMRSLRRQVKVGLISNAWSGLRPWIVNRKFEDVFDAMIISAEVGDGETRCRASTRLPLKQLGVTALGSVFVDDFPENVTGCAHVWHAGHPFHPAGAGPVQELKQLLANHH